MTSGLSTLARLIAMLSVCVALSAVAAPGCIPPAAEANTPGPEQLFAVGACLADANDAAAAEAWFAEHAAALSSPHWRAAVANERGRLRIGEGRDEAARVLFEQARGLGDAAVAAAATLNLARLAPMPRRLELLREARDLAQRAARPELEARALDEIAQRQEDHGDLAAARRSNAEAVLLAGRLGSDALLMPLAWRSARLLRAQGDQAGALAAFQQAADLLERIRQDIPVVYSDGRSSFRTTFAPVYLGLADLLLRSAPGESPEAHLDRARRAVERIKRSELEDYLGERCLADAGAGPAGSALDEGTAVLYPIMLDDRLELLVEHGGRLQRATVAVSQSALDAVARSYASELRRGEESLARARTLHGWLLAPVEALLGERLRTLVVIPDASLRLFPFASLHDGTHYAIEKYAVAVAPGLELTEFRATARGGSGLLAGLAEPGEVVNRLPPRVLQALGEGAADAGGVRALSRGAAAGAAPGPDRTARLQQALALPGVREEIDALSALGAGTALVDREFTVAAFERELAGRDFRLVHIASHGVFGDSAETTFLMAHDDIISIDRLQALLTARGGEQSIELLTLSACETAEGDDRAPLGLAGTALQARAGAALGSLWPVADEATKELMAAFYRHLLGGERKVDALRAAQLELLGQAAYRAPFFWAPFILVGDWN